MAMRSAELLGQREWSIQRQIQARIWVSVVEMRRFGRSLTRTGLLIVLGFWIGMPTAVKAHDVSVSVSTTPINVAPGGRMAYGLAALNNSLERVDASVSLSFDSHLTFIASHSRLESCTTCATADDCHIPCVGDSCPPSPSPSPRMCGGAGVCVDPDADACVSVSANGTKVVFGNLTSGAYKRVALEFELASDTPVSEIRHDPNPPHDMQITNQIEITATTTAYISGNLAPQGSSAEPISGKTSVGEENYAPLQGSLNATPSGVDENDRAAPGESITYRAMVTNGGALSRDVTLELTPDLALTVHEVAAQQICTPAGRCFVHCSSPGVADPAGCFDSTQATGTTFPFLGVEPGQVVQLRVNSAIAPSTIRTRLTSVAKFRDGLSGLEVTTGDIHTNIDVCSGRPGGACDDGDACQDDTCGVDGKCTSPTCSEACKGAEDGIACNDNDDLCQPQVCESERCVPKTTSTGQPASPDCGACQVCDPNAGCITNTAPAFVCRSAQGPCQHDLVCDGFSATCPPETQSYDANGTPCDDGDSSTSNEVCVAQTNGPPACRAQSSCGDGTLDPDRGEECDDGNQIDGDCCSSFCTFEPEGTPCGNGNVCDGDELCNAGGQCQAGTPLTCDPGSVCQTTACNPVVGCEFFPAPASNCKVFGKGTLLVNAVRPGYESLILNLKQGPEITQAEFGDPTADDGTGYTLCFYREDNAGFAGDLQLDRAGTSCREKPCWWKRGARGYRYTDRDYGTEGIGSVKLEGGKAGRSRIFVRGQNNAKKGQTSLPAGRTPPDLSIAAGLNGAYDGARVQLRTSESSLGCFESTLSRVMRSGPSYFRAKR